MFDFFKNCFAYGTDCSDPILKQICCPMDSDNSMGIHSSEPIGGCTLDLNGNGICDFVDPVSPLNPSNIFSHTWELGSLIFDDSFSSNYSLISYGNNSLFD